MALPKVKKKKETYKIPKYKTNKLLTSAITKISQNNT